MGQELDDDVGRERETPDEEEAVDTLNVSPACMRSRWRGGRDTAHPPARFQLTHAAQLLGRLRILNFLGIATCACWLQTLAQALSSD